MRKAVLREDYTARNTVFAMPLMIGMASKTSFLIMFDRKQALSDVFLPLIGVPAGLPAGLGPRQGRDAV